MTVVWLIGMGIGALVSVYTFFGSDPESAPQQAVIGVWSLYYLILPYTCCRAIEGVINAQKPTLDVKGNQTPSQDTGAVSD